MNGNGRHRPQAPQGVRLGVITAIVLALAAWIPPAAHALDFVSAGPFTVGTSPSSVATGDFNEDSEPDLAVANGTSDDVSILLGGAGGTFTNAPGSPIAVGDGPVAIAVGDFNGGSDPDLVVANIWSSSVSILLGGMGASFTYAPGSPIAVGNRPDAVAIGDFNGDLDADLAVANFFSDDVSILLGGMGGSFTTDPGSPVAVGTGPDGVATGDFNGDLDADLAVANYFSNDVSILLGDAGASFTNAPGSPVPVGSNPSGITVGNFDADSDPELAVANTGSLPGDVSILLGGAGASFTNAPGSPVPVGSSPYSVVVGKFDTNADPDLAVVNSGGNDVSILFGGAGASFTNAPGNFSVGNYPYGIAVSDFDADTDDDVATANQFSDDVSILLQINTPGYARPKGASPANFRLVPAFDACTAPDGSHGPPLDEPSCNPPVQSSTFLTLHAPDRPAPYNTAALGGGSLVMKVLCDNAQAPPCPASGDQEDIGLTSGITDVRCVAAGPNCSAAGAQYIGKLLFDIPLRITDKLSGAGQTAGATPLDTQLQFGMQCSSGSCSVATSADSVIPGLVREGKRAVWGLGRVEVRDGGTDGDLVDAPAPAVGTCPPVCAGNGGETVFLHQGLFVP